MDASKTVMRRSGHGGQTLLSSTASEKCPQIAAREVHDLGVYHLKDLDEPEHAFELRHPKLPIVELNCRPAQETAQP